MAKIKTNNGIVCFDPYTDDVDGHFSSVVEKFFDKMWRGKHGVSYQEYKEMANTSLDGRVPLRKIREVKKYFAEGVNRQFSERGLDTLKNFAGKENSMDFILGWDIIKESVKDEFKIPDRPTNELEEIPEEPSLEDEEFKADIDIIDYIIPSRRESKEKEHKKEFKKAHEKWKKEVSRAEKFNEEKLDKWEEKKEISRLEKRKLLDKINSYEERYKEGENNIVEDVVSAKIKKTRYPTYLSFVELRNMFDRKVDISYRYRERELVLNFCLPSIEKLPNRKGVKYVGSSGKFKGININESKKRSIYEKIPFNIAIRVSRQVLEFDFSSGRVIDHIVFNGFISPSGQADDSRVEKCKVSLQCSLENFEGGDLSGGEPQATFDRLGGISAPSMFDASSVEPIMHTASQAPESASAVGTYNFEGKINLAQLEWSEFEQLIADLFDQEFANEDGEVKVTQKSQEGGIDAIAHDPDLLRGGKFVLHAQRSVQTVGVSAVRNLHKRSMSEDADKGVLVTTSDFSRSAHDFAKDKLIQLLNGDDLLRLLDRHGYDAEIDWDTARREN